MITMKQQSLWNKRIPNILTLFFIISGIVITLFLIKKSIIFNSSASANDIPQHVQISNITNTSFTVTYITNSLTFGSLSIEKNKLLNKTILDDRDKNRNSPQPHSVHSFTLSNLSPNTTYYFSISSGSTTYTNNNTFFSATTGPLLASSNALHKTISGTVILPQNTDEIVVYLQASNGQLLSTLADSQGFYTFSITNSRTNDLARYEQVQDNDPVSITITDGKTSSHVLTELGNAQKIAPVGISQNYNFIAENNQIRQTENSYLGFPAFTTQIASTVTIPAILSPKHNESFVDQQPQFSGLAQPNATVTITIHSDTALQTQVAADNTGQWKFRPDTPLSIGDHTISITTSDTSGTMQTITQNFSIFPIGTQVLQTATPSATLTPTNSSTPTPTSNPTPSIGLVSPAITPTSFPSATITPTSSPTPAATMTPTPTQITIPSPTRASLPPTGNPFIFPIGILSILTTILGIGIFIL